MADRFSQVEKMPKQNSSIAHSHHEAAGGQKALAEEWDPSTLLLETGMPAITRQNEVCAPLDGGEEETMTIHQWQSFALQHMQANAAAMYAEQWAMLQLPIAPTFVHPHWYQVHHGQVQMAQGIMPGQQRLLRVQGQGSEYEVTSQHGGQCASRGRRLRRKANRRTETGARSAASMSTVCSDERCAKLKEDLDAGGDACIAAVAAIRGQVLPLALEPAGCRLIQHAIETLSHEFTKELVAELHGRVLEAIESPHANYVIQKVVEWMPPAERSFVISELRFGAAKMARHRNGCRILCRLLEHYEREHSACGELIDEVLAEVETLCCHPYGHHVLEWVLEYGRVEQRHRICSALLSNLMNIAQDRHGSFVVQAALKACSPEDVHDLREFLSGPDIAEALTKTHWGAYVTDLL